MIGRVRKYILENRLLTDGQQIIAGLSGGADSVALCHMLVQLGYECIAAHCNFHLRGEESDRDAQFVEDFCKLYNIKLFHTDFDTAGYAANRRISIEMAARELRYDWFGQLSDEHNVNRIAVAHHRDDSVETVILNLVRGTGVRGLTGIPVANSRIVRPLLCLGRMDILSYINQHGLGFVTDSTNDENIYTRNKVRNEIIPLLETINPSAKESINRTSGYLAQVAGIYYEYIEQAKRDVIKNNTIDIRALMQSKYPEAILFEILSPYQFNSATIRQILESADAIPGKQFYSETHILVKDRDCFILSEQPACLDECYTIDENVKSLTAPVSLEIEIFGNNQGLEIEKSGDFAYFNLHKLHFPLKLRRWKQGDWFVPFGMKGRKKLSDYFSDNKFSVIDKQNVWILCSGDDIVWLVGHRSDNRYRVEPDTKFVLRIRILR